MQVNVDSFTTILNINNISDLHIASQKYKVILCSETFVSSFRNVSEELLCGFNESKPQFSDLAGYIRSGYSATIWKDNVCNCHEVQLILVCSRLNKFYSFKFYHNSDLNDLLYDCLLTSMSNIQQKNRNAAFKFVGDVNAHNQKWLGSINCVNIVCIHLGLIQHRKSASDTSQYSYGKARQQWRGWFNSEWLSH